MRRGALLGLLWLAGPAGAGGQDASLKADLPKFADLAAHRAAAAFAGVTRFPLRNDVYGQPQRVDASGFARHFAVNGYPAFAACLRRATPRPAAANEKDLGAWAVDCDGTTFFFAREAAGWRHSGFQNVNE